MIKKVSHILLSFVLLITTVGLTINLHYCAGDLYSIAIDSKADNCCDDDEHLGQMKDMDHHNICHTDGNDMKNCEDETVIVKISDKFTKTVQNININNSFVIILFNTLPQSEINFFSANEDETDFDNFNNSRPFTRQILSLFQTYRL